MGAIGVWYHPIAIDSTLVGVRSKTTTWIETILKDEVINGAISRVKQNTEVIVGLESSDDGERSFDILRVRTGKWSRFGTYQTAPSSG